MKSSVMIERFDRALLVGGTGMLEAVSIQIARRSDQLTLACRNPGPLAKRLDAVPLSLDWGKRNVALQQLESLSSQNLIVAWLHKAGEWMQAELHRKLAPNGRLVRIYGSASALKVIEHHAHLNAPNVMNAPNIAPVAQIVLLGWKNLHQGRRWLTDAEICAAVMEAVLDPEKKLTIAGTLEKGL